MKLLVLLCILHLSTTYSTNEGWQWSWKCKSGKCVRSEKPSSPNDVTGVSQNICKLICGKYGALWPMPTGETTIGSQVVAFHPSRLTLELSQVNGRPARDYMARAGKLYQTALYAQCGADCSIIPETKVTVYIRVTNSDIALNWDTDESYVLAIATKGTDIAVQIQAPTVFGARHGLETLNQLITDYSTGGARGSRSASRVLVLVSEASIADRPAFPHRGLVIDTARNYLPLPALYRTVDGMASVKMNVFHWHITDSQSFPLMSPRVPKLTEYGAYSFDQIYSTYDIVQFIEYARLKGIRVVIEIDAPAHSGNGWQFGEEAGLGKLAVCVNEQPWRKYCIQPPCGQLNPANPNLYPVLQDLYRDILDLLPPGEVFHMGGDEVFFACWNSSSEVVDYMTANGQGRNLSDFLDLWGEYQGKVLNLWDEINPINNSPVVLWSSHLTEPGVIEKYLNNTRYVIQTWVEKNKSLPGELLAKGYRLIMTTKDTWYLDRGFWGGTAYQSWRAAYDNRLPANPLVLGGEAAMWAELVDDASLDTKVWPRAGAVAERLWSNPKSQSLTAEPRFQQLRQRLVRLGLRPDGLSPQYCTQNERECF